MLGPALPASPCLLGILFAGAGTASPEQEAEFLAQPRPLPLEGVGSRVGNDVRRPEVGGEAELRRWEGMEGGQETGATRC